MKKNKIFLITGCAGFIGYSLAEYLLKKGFIVHGIDNLNDYYNVNYKTFRIKQLKKKYINFSFSKKNLCVSKKIITKNFDCIFHLAAQVGVRGSEKNYFKYVNDNIIAFNNLLRQAKLQNIKNIVFASSSSVYNSNVNNIPFKEEINYYNPLSIYGISKLTKEKLAEYYSLNFKLNIIGLRFFSVFGEFGRPDMAILKFINLISLGKQITVNNNGLDSRDYTYIDDVVYYLFKSYKYISLKKNIFELINVGSGKPIILNDLVKIISESLQLNPKIKFLKSKNENKITKASNKKLFKILGKRKFTPIDDGISKVIFWYKKFKAKQLFLN